MDTRLLDMLHDAADHRHFPVADRIDIHLDGILQEFVDQHRMFLDGPADCLHEIPDALIGVDNAHIPAAEDIGGPDNHRIADPLGGGQRLFQGVGRVVFRLTEVQLLQELLETLAVFRPVDGVGRGADDLDPGLLQRYGQVERGLAAELDDDPVRFFQVDDVQDILPGQRLEVEFVRGVVVGGDRLRVRVDHDRFDADLSQRKGRMHTAVIELDSLADPVRAAAQNHDLFPVADLGLVFHLVGGIAVRGVGFEFRSAGIHQLVDRQHPQLFAQMHGHRFRMSRSERKSACRKIPLPCISAENPRPAPGNRAAGSVASVSTICFRLCRNQGSIRVSS